jgi:RNA polymerase sigma factor (sigma-70 family)
MFAQLIDEPTLELIVKGRAGDNLAIEALLQRSLPKLHRWAHGRLPMTARSQFDTCDLVQEVAMSVLARLNRFEPGRAGSLQAYFRRSVMNKIRDEVRRTARQPMSVELDDTLPCSQPSPLERVANAEAYENYRDALATLGKKDRNLVVARLELQLTLQEIQGRFGFRSTDTARVAVRRALQRFVVRYKKSTARAFPKE